MKNSILLSFLFLLLFNSTVFAQEKKEYGRTAENPILVGGEGLRKGPVYEQDYLNRLSGPNGEAVSFERGGSCCQFETPNGILGGGLLDKFAVTYDGLEEQVILFLNMYDPNEGELKAPEGFILKD